MYCKSRTNGVGLWDPRVGNMTYPEPYRNPLRRLYPGMSKSMDGLGQLTDKAMNAVSSYNINSAQNNSWRISEFGRSIGINSPGHPTIGGLAYAFQKKYGLTADGKIGPRTLSKIFDTKNYSISTPPTSSDPEYIVMLIERRPSGFNPPSPDGGGRRSGGGGGGGGTTPRRSMSDGDEMNLDVAPPPKDPKDPKKSSIPMPLAIGGGVLIAVGLALFMKNKN